MPMRGRPPDTIASQPSNNGAESTAASSPSSNPAKLAHQQNWASQAEPRSQSTSAADHTITSPADQQCVGTPSPGWTAAEAPPSGAGLDVQEETTSLLSRRHGGHGLRDEREFHRPPRHRFLGLGGAAAPLPHCSFLRLQEGSLFEVDPRKTLPAYAPAPGHPKQPAVHLHSDKHVSHRLRIEPAPGPNGRRDRGPPEAEPADRTSTKVLSTDGHLANANLEQGSMRAIPGNNKYPVM